MINALKFYKCLADETRLNSILLIHKHDELCVCELQAALNVSQPMISRHLAELRRCGILTTDRRGKWVYYRLNQKLPGWAKEIISKTPLLTHYDFESCTAIELKNTRNLRVII